MSHSHFPRLSPVRPTSTSRARTGAALVLLTALGLASACNDDDTSPASCDDMSQAGSGGEATGGTGGSETGGTGTGGLGEGGEGGKVGGCGSLQIKCDGECVYIDTDEAHCGSCGNECNTGQSCNDGICTTVSESTHSIDTGLAGLVSGFNSQLKIDGDGDAVLVWTIAAPQPALYANTYDASKKTWSAPKKLADTVYGTGQLALDAAGNAFVVWNDGDTGVERDVWLTSYDKSSGKWAAPEVIDQADLETSSANLSVAGDGTVIVAWSETHADYSTSLMLRRSQPGGTFEQDAVPLAAASGSCAFGTNPAGQVFCAFATNDDALYASRWDDGAWTEPELIVEADTHLYFSALQVFVSDAGEATVLIGRKVYNATPSADSLWAVRYVDGAWTEATGYLGDGYNAYGMDASMATNGDVFMSWLEYDTPYVASKFGAMRLDAETGEWSEPTTVTLPSHANSSTIIAADNQGGALCIAALSTAQVRERVYSVTFTDADDTLNDAEIFPTNDFDDNRPAIAYGKDGKGLVVWPSSSSVESRLYWREL